MIKKVIFLMGPTCVGKTEISIKLANYFNIEIISTDSCMIYKKMNIGTGKPSDKLLIKNKHHFVDIINPEENFSVEIFCKNSKQIIEKCFLKKKLLYLLAEV